MFSKTRPPHFDIWKSRRTFGPKFPDTPLSQTNIIVKRYSIKNTMFLKFPKKASSMNILSLTGGAGFGRSRLDIITVVDRVLGKFVFRLLPLSSQGFMFHFSVF